MVNVVRPCWRVVMHKRRRRMWLILEGMVVMVVRLGDEVEVAPSSVVGRCLWARLEGGVATGR